MGLSIEFSGSSKRPQSDEGISVGKNAKHTPRRSRRLTWATDRLDQIKDGDVVLLIARASAQQIVVPFGG